VTGPLRCAIYTRKSSEEGLEQGFNSLHAQREACEAYVLSQAGEGWSALAAEYDDGGFSGGSMERPAIQRLLADIEGGKIDIVVVYKVDRLTRSLADFARIVELFDRRRVSFVSVTQAFNTTSSMGRLTLNVLLSFAQFEREVTGERIRDKIAASKAKGLWMGGRPPLGYDGKDAKLLVNEPEAKTVRLIFARYIELGCVRRLQANLEEDGIRSKRWIGRRGEPRGGQAFGRGALYHLLSNPVYRGVIRHKDKTYPGAHQPIVDEELWDAVQAQLRDNGPNRPQVAKRGNQIYLAGLLFDQHDRRMQSVHTTKGASRYRYYATASVAGLPLKPTRIAQGVLDQLVQEQGASVLAPSWLPGVEQLERIRRALTKVMLSADKVTLEMDAEAVVAWPDSRIRRNGDRVTVTVTVTLKHRQGAMFLSVDGAAPSAAGLDRALVRAVCLAKGWAHMLAGGEAGSVKELARRHGLCEHYAAKLMPLAWLAPDLIQTILDGAQPKSISLSALIARSLPLSWKEQRAHFWAL
jgi:site-specific DNA recombinase